MMKREELMYREASDLLSGLQRDAFGNLKPRRAAEIQCIVSGMLHSFSEHDFKILKAEIIQIRLKQDASLRRWQRIQGNH